MNYLHNHQSIVRSSQTNDENNETTRPTAYTRLEQILRQNRHLVELKLNRSITKPLSKASKSIRNRSNDEFQKTYQYYLKKTFDLIDSIVPSRTTTYQTCWPHVFLIYFIEKFQHSFDLILSTNNEIVDGNHVQQIIGILRKSSRFQIDSSGFDYLRRIIILKNNEQRTAFIKELNKLKEYLYEQNQNKTKLTLIYSKILLFLSSLSSIERETVEKIFFPKIAR